MSSPGGVAVFVHNVKPSPGVALVMALAIAGVALVLFQTSGLGPGVTTDSVAYLSSADSFYSSGRLVMFDGTPLVRWPPGYPVALAAVRVAGVDALGAARLVNAVCFGVVIAFTGVWLLRRTASPALGVLAAVALFVSIPLLNVATLALSEIMFAVFVILYVAALDRADRSERTIDAALAGGLVALATVTRYAGLGLALGGAMVLWGLRPIRSSLARVGVFSVATLAPVLPWFARNEALGGTTRGGFLDQPLTTSGEAVALTIDAVATTLLPPALPREARIALVVVAVAVLIALLGGALRRAEGRQRSLARTAALVGVVLLGYVVFVYVCSLFGMSEISQRMFAPMYPALVAVIILGFHAAVDVGRPRSQLVLRAAAVGIAVGLVLYPAWYAWNMTRYSRSVGGGGGYNTRAWRSSELVKAVASLGPEATVVSNAPGAVYLWSGRRAQGFGARHYPPEPDGFSRGLRSLDAQLDTLGGAYVAVFDSTRVQYSYVYTQEHLSQIGPVEVVSTWSDGVLYRSVPSETAHANGAR